MNTQIVSPIFEKEDDFLIQKGKSEIQVLHFIKNSL